MVRPMSTTSAIPVAIAAAGIRLGFGDDGSALGVSRMSLTSRRWP
jgi:hypothetical protein